MLTPGTLLQNRYQIIQPLGGGGMGTVYLATDLRLGNTRVAVKENHSGDPRLFQIEANMLASLRHPNLPRMIDHFVEPSGAQYLVMDYIEGQNLAEVVRSRGLLTERDALAWMQQVLDAVQYLHSNHIIHRDIKPQNIIITPDRKAILVDFGIARVLVPGQITLALAHGFGSPSYAPPEQATGGTDERSDVYSLGATLYFALTGLDPPEFSRRAYGTPVPPIRQRNTTVSANTERVILKAMSLDGRLRFATVADLQHALHPPPTRGLALSATLATLFLVLLAGVVTVNQFQQRSEQASATTIAVRRTEQAATLTAELVRQTEVAATSTASVVRQTEEAGATMTVVAAQSTRAARDTATAVTLRQTESVQATQSAVAQAKSTAQAQASMTAAAQASATVAVRVAATLSVQPELIYGPASGRLPPDERGLVSDLIVVSGLRNFTAQVRFYNPDNRSGTGWDYGFGFRGTGPNKEYRLFVDSNRNWTLSLAMGVQNQQVALKDLGTGRVKNLNVSSGDSNELRLEVKQNRARLFTNGTLTAELDVSQKTDAGDLSIGSAFLDNHLEVGRAIRYENLTIWSERSLAQATATTRLVQATATAVALDQRTVFGPSQGELTHVNNDRIEGAFAGVSLQNFIAEAKFYNPYTPAEHPWDFGMTFRNTSANNQYRLIISSDKRWDFTLSTGSDSKLDSTLLAFGYLQNLDVSATGSNTLRVLVKNETALFFLNDSLVSVLNVSGKMERGDVLVGTGFYNADEWSGHSTRYEGFTVWSLP